MAERLYKRRIPPTQVVSQELGHELCQFSFDTKRQIGLLVDRRGMIDHVIIGDANRLWLPDIGRLRAGRGRLRGLRLIHTHLRGEPLSNDDLTDLALLRLDMVVAIALKRDGRAGAVYMAHLLPENPQGDISRQLEPIELRRLELDFEALIRALETEFSRSSDARVSRKGETQAILVHVHTKEQSRTIAACIEELKELCRTAGVSVLDTVIQKRDKPDPKFVVGKGKLEELIVCANQLGAELLILDPDLSPAQARAISESTELKVLDRSMLILDIFAQHAHSRDGKLQVELAQLRYTLPRLVEKNTMMSRLTGGIGGRGPGETKLEINRRRARERITRLERQIEELSVQRAERRSLRQHRGLPVISIVGYTNAGKSTLLNTLTHGDALVEDKLFATLHPLSRRLRFPREREVIITDTVGFIHDLPKELVTAFRATLEELADADLLIHLVDISSENFRDQVESVERILHDLNLSEKPKLLVFNKIDKLSDEQLSNRVFGQEAIAISAQRSETTKPLLSALERMLWKDGYDQN